MLKTVNIINFVYIRPTAQLGLNKSSIYLSISLFLSFEFRWAFGKQVGCTRALSLYPRASLRASQLPWDSDSGRIVRGSEGSESVRERERERFFPWAMWSRTGRHGNPSRIGMRQANPPPRNLPPVASLQFSLSFSLFAVFVPSRYYPTPTPWHLHRRAHPISLV